ncbi:MAG: hypothetical protein KKH12_05520 [Gammaproteobacteria bacterium]|nr:hypothetical protein [Gammaproteobacteria bacterium]MBU1481119.1 hypothetical protein [Gammaproteobacteria bacterium]
MKLRTDEQESDRRGDVADQGERASSREAFVVRFVKIENYPKVFKIPADKQFVRLIASPRVGKHNSEHPHWLNANGGVPVIL